MYRALAEAEEGDEEAEVQVISPRWPVRAWITGPGSGTDSELMEQLIRQVIVGDNMLDDLVRKAQDGPDEVVVHS
ncbi:hypothetical protein ACFZAG_04455 [Streptomyces sp. NPDC012403]|uniref:hypothetical protein n=1 Tax=Streptomyces sp. NPDC012403 TaxID=3364831 RepID=UPI0036ED2021